MATVKQIGKYSGDRPNIFFFTAVDDLFLLGKDEALYNFNFSNISEKFKK